MLRRSFMQSFAAAFALPAISTVANCYGVRQFDFAPWVDRYTSRFDLSKPFDWNDMTIATDGRKLICVSKLSSVEVDGKRALPRVGHLPWDNFESGGWKRFECERRKPNPASNGSTCEQCLGLGWLGNVTYGKFDPRTGPKDFLNDFVVDKYYDIDGAMDREDVIKHLDQHGWETEGWHSDRYCEACNASGFDDEGSVCVVDGIGYDSGYIASIARFGDFEIRQEDYQTDNKAWHKLLLFRGHDFKGMVMPRALI